ncbi:T9SS type B sorting domain-containing protein [Capnocytophaga stomatis]|uniref:T9SS type B sorting domain-containing protein n=1 Tax=Capnocytophaga stomatis TaxID=1848904 RepID=UPI001AC5762E|nr:T9SS type B sorting domain-containing protein [Capnocytophaga stomatis]GIM49193.1 hypothetical protein CAPN003_06450 [Capnocytophaga stomatis]
MKKLIFLTFLLLSYVGVFSQVHIPFQIRQKENLKGGLRMIGNQILNKHPANENHNNDWGMNDLLPMKYVDIDNDENTFSSSAATLTFDNPTCSKIKYAGLYWGGVYLQNDPNRRNIKIKIPSQTNYIDIEADTFIYDGYPLNIQQGRDSYICYKDITELLSNTNPTGEYVVANVKATQTTEAWEVSGGVSAGWSLVIIYEDPDKSNKNITTFDGYARITKGEKVDFSFSGFKTLPSPLPVNARFGVMALEGDKDIPGDKLSILKPDGSYEDLSNSINPADNFFNSSISEDENLIIDRRPASTNTLGWDIDLFSIPNTNNSIIQNDQEDASFRAHSTGDLYNIFFSAFEVEVIEPKMNLLKTAEDATGNVLNNQTIPLGSTVYYGLEFQNVGNDNAVDYEIKDLLPKNVTLDTNIPFEIPSGSGITYSVSNSANGSEVTFKIPNDLVKKGGGKYKVRFAVKLSPNCSDFTAPCSERILNKAKSVYKGTLNQSIINDNGSFSSIDNCNIGVLDDTVFYADLTPCVIPENIELLCGENLILTAQAGFDGYEWQDNAGNIISSNQNAIISKSGRYTLTKHTNNCVDRKEIYNVSTIQRQGTNPLIPYSEVTFTCLETERTFPQIFLCGMGASKSVDLTSIPDVATVNLEKYTGNQKLALEETCPPTDNSWQNISNSKTFSLTEEGIYKLNLTFQNSCLATYYFRVHASPINPTISKKDIYCKNGKISVQNAGSDYEYAIELQGTTEPPVYQQSPDFEIETAGIYSVFVRKKLRLEQDCVIRIDNINVEKFDQQLQVTKTQSPCAEQVHGISFKVFDGQTPYKAILRNNKTNVAETLNNIAENTEYSFTDLSLGDYTLTVNDSDDCPSTYNFTVEESEAFINLQKANPLIAHSGVTFTCSETHRTFPQIFLCGMGTSKSIDLTSIANVATVNLQKYTGNQKFALEETCPPNDNMWQNISNSKIFPLTEEGIYKLNLSFQDGCKANYFFRVHTSPINPTISKEDIYCANGKISVQNASSDYEYAVQLQNSSAEPTYQESTDFQINEPGIYSVFVRKKMRLEQDCVIKIENINIRKFEQQLQIVQIHNESCENQNDGSISFKIFDGKFPYTAVLKNNKTNTTETSNNIGENIEVSFANIPPSDYTLTVNDSGVCENVYSFSIKEAISLKFNTSNELLCINNTSISQLTLAFEDANLDLSKVSYSFNNETTKLPFDKIQGRTALLYPKNLPNGSNQISVFYNNCTFTQIIDFQNINPLKITQIRDNTLPSAIKISVSGGSGNYYFYFNDVHQSSDTYYLRSFDEGYVNSNGQEVKKIRVRVEDSLGCVIEEVLEEIFHDIKIPNYFTPDGDGINDTWQIKNAQGYSRMKIDIYDRMGRKLKTLTSRDSWDGTFNGANLPSGDYWYHLQFNEAKDRRTYTGHFTLYR